MSILKNKNTSQIVSIGPLGEWNGKDMRVGEWGEWEEEEEAKFIF